MISEELQSRVRGHPGPESVLLKVGVRNVLLDLSVALDTTDQNI